SFGVPLTGLPLVMGVDRLLDMARTTVNVTGDLVLCRILAPKGQAADHLDAVVELVAEPPVAAA
ncbi:MAG TPA: cation:dicarboxylase symporter family transporter, partial [Hyphomonas sp.]|nr:cation:dicarboxylase symporter family transporter [Hyphomonas sp.]